MSFIVAHFTATSIELMSGAKSRNQPTLEHYRKIKFSIHVDQISRSHA